jgi:cation diffusion facilitator family transporter
VTCTLDAGTRPRNALPMDAPAPPPAPPAAPHVRFSDADDRRLRVRAGVIALVVGIVLLGSKFYAWRLTDSQTVFSDAMESIVNVAAAAIALFAISFAARPADDDHPYGHGKIEFVTAGFEGGLIAFAGLTIVYEAISALVAGHEPKKLDFGIGIVAAAGVANLLLGLFLLRTGRRHASPALQADGHHVISDFWTSAGAVVGLVLVRLTGLAWIDATTAVLFALLLFWTGGKMLRQAARGLLDETDPGVIDEIAAALEAARTPGIIEVHDLRAINVGDRRHVDLHAVVPEFWTVDRGAPPARRVAVPRRSLRAHLLRPVRPRRLRGARQAVPRAAPDHGRVGRARPRARRCVRGLARRRLTEPPPPPQVRPVRNPIRPERCTAHRNG